MRPSAATLDMMERLVGVDTTSRNSNLPIIELIQGHLESLGIKPKLVFDAPGRKANLYATLGPEDRGGVALSGHTDVVPVDGQEWSTDPWRMEERDGRLYGRGTSDMKGFVAVALALLPDFLKRGLKTPLHLALSYDEEVGCVGVRRLLELLRDMPLRPAACIVGEPTSMKVIVAHKGKKSVRCHVRGFECHSSLAPRGVNAIEMAAEVITYLRGMAQRAAAEGPFDPDYDIPHTTIHTGIVRGGTALNIVPKDCSFDFEFRYLAGEDPEALFAEVRGFAERELLPAMQAIAPDTGFSWEEISAFPGLDTREEDEVAQLGKSLSGANGVGKVAFGTEAGLYQKTGIPTIICGPGSIEQAHKPDEWVSLEQLALCEGFMHRLMDRVCLRSA